MSRNKFRIYLRNLVFLMLFIIFSCDRNINHDDSYSRFIDNVSNQVCDMEFKGMESIEGAIDVFNDYKTLKLVVIKKALLNENFMSEMKDLEEMRHKFNKITLNEVLLPLADNNAMENNYIKEFENAFIENYIKLALPDLIVNIETLKIVYAN